MRRAHDSTHTVDPCPSTSHPKPILREPPNSSRRSGKDQREAAGCDCEGFAGGLIAPTPTPGAAEMAFLTAAVNEAECPCLPDQVGDDFCFGWNQAGRQTVLALQMSGHVEELTLKH